MRYFSRNLYNRLQLSSLFPFKSIDSVNAFWDELYVNDYKVNQEYYENQIREAMPEIFEKLSHGERIFSRKGPSEHLLAQLRIVDELWRQTCDNYDEYFETIKCKLPSCILKFRNDELQEARVVDVGMTHKENIFIKLDTRFTELNLKGIDSILMNFHGLKSIKTVGAIQLQRWLYSEVHLSDEGEFELRILFESGELTLVADDVECEMKNHLSEFEFIKS